MQIVVVGRDTALVEELHREIEASGLVERCRPAAPEDDLRALADEGWERFVVVPGEVRGFPDVAEARRVFAALSASAPGTILVSSAAVNEPNAHHPGLVPEERLPAQRNANPLTARWRALEETAREALGEDAAKRLTILRPAAVLVRGGESFWSRLFAGAVAFVPPGFDPTLQLLAGRDLAIAVRRLVERGPAAGGVYNLAPSSGMAAKKALRAARTWRLAVPVTLQRPFRKVFAGLGAAPPEQLEYLRYSWTVSDEKIRRELDLGPALSSSQAVATLRGESVPDPGPTGEEFDPFGLDREYTGRLGKTFFRFLHDAYWRIEHRGLENVPRQGGVVLTGVHRGHQPWDGVMAMYLLEREIGRCPRFLVHPTLVKFPFLAPYMIKCGGVHACVENADWVLERDEIVAIFPEGIRGAFRMYKDVYKLGRFGRHEYVKLALRHQVPIVPFVTVGSAEIFPIYGKIRWSWWKRYSEWPFFPITPTMGTVPLPSKWHTHFLEPLHVEREYPPEAADDLATVRAISQEARARMTAALEEMLARRRSVFFGSVFREGTA